MASYRIVLSGPQGQLDALAHALAEENGIEFYDTKDSHKINENDKEIPRERLEWGDKVKVELNYLGEPIGYKYIGSQNSGIELPKTKDWRRFYVSRSGNEEKILSPELKVWYRVDSSG